MSTTIVEPTTQSPGGKFHLMEFYQFSYGQFAKIKWTNELN
jgi:hypothetical protein